MTPLVSIIIPAYNAEQWIRQTLESAVNQDYPNREIIVVNDGSSDRTLAIARTFESASVRIVDQPNAGGPAARNRGLACARGDYIQWLDHDDLLAPDKISVQLRAAGTSQNQRVLLSSPFGTFFYRPEKAKLAPGPLWRDLTPLEYFQLKFGENTWLQTSCWLVSRKLTDSAGPWWELKSPDDDGEYFCRIVAASERIQFVPQARCYWRVGNYQSFSTARSAATFEARFRATSRCIEHFRGLDDSEATRLACVKFLQHRLEYFYPEFEEAVRRLRALARELGGDLRPPPLKLKYRLIHKLFGWKATRQAQALLPRIRVGALRSWDRLMFELSARGVA